MDQLIYDVLFAAVFTTIGVGIGYTAYTYKMREIIEQAISSCVTDLIDDGFLRTEGVGRDERILPWDWSEDEASK